MIIYASARRFSSNQLPTRSGNLPIQLNLQQQNTFRLLHYHTIVCNLQAMIAVVITTRHVASCVADSIAAIQNWLYI